MSGYTVKIEELGELIKNLETAADRIADANKKLAAHSTLGALGNETLASAGSSFEETWEYGISKLGEAAVQVTEGLVEAKKDYAHVEELHTEVLGKIGNNMDSPPLINDMNSPAAHGGSGATPPGEADAPQGIPGGGYTGGIRDVLDGPGL